MNPDTAVLLKQIGIGFLVLSTIALLLVGVWYGTRINSLTITTIEIYGGETISHQELQKLSEQALEGNYIGLIPKRFSWFYPEEDVYKALQSNDRVHNILINREGGTKLKIDFDEYIPTALWCTETDKGDCFFVDQDGFSFSKAPSLVGGSFLRFITTEREPKVRETLMDKSLLEAIFSLVAKLAEQNWFVSSIEIDQVNDVFLKIAGGGEIKVSLNDPQEKIIENLLVILNSPEFTHIKPGNFQYIDLRFGSKVFVNEEIAVPKEESATSTASSTTTGDVLEN
jgi:cell division septal protein FtsQ